MRNTGTLEENASRIPQCFGETAGPEVLPEQQGGGGAGLELRRDELDVLEPDQTSELTFELIESVDTLQLVDFKDQDTSVLVLADEDEVEDTHRPRLDQRDELRGYVSGELVSGGTPR
jgi:hypothetical protein